MNISLCLLVWNEINGCKIDIPRLPREEFNEVYAVDGGSTDGTVEYLRSNGIKIYQQPKKGLNAAYIHATECSRCEALVIYFPKGTIDPLTLKQFRPLLEAGYDLVIASRLINEARNEEDDNILKFRKWGVYFLAIFANVLWRREGYFIRDVLHGYKGFTTAAFRKIAPLDYGLSIDIEMVIRSYKLHLKRSEIPVKEFARPFGQTRFKIVPTAKKLLKYLWHEYKRGK